MRVLLDTHLLLWSLFDLDRIGGDAVELLKRPETGVVISAVSFWEISIKRATGKMVAPDDLPAIVRALGHDILDVTPEHAWVAGALPRFHADPFDRLLIAQSQVEKLPLVTHDGQMGRYDVRLVRA